MLPCAMMKRVAGRDVCICCALSCACLHTHSAVRKIRHTLLKLRPAGKQLAHRRGMAGPVSVDPGAYPMR